jgi:predicted nucleic acid-binding Zn ribbon protein
MTHPAADARPPRHCYKCGREFGPDESICEVCNRAGMVTPSASQYHGTMVVAIIAGVVGLALWASLAMRGVGPYQATVTAIAPAEPDSAIVTVQVHNAGTGRGAPTCRMEARAPDGRPLGSAALGTSRIEGGATGTFTGTIPGMPELPDSVVVSCN